MYVLIGLSVRTGLPWEYWEGQDDEVIATALDILVRAAKRGRSGAPTEAMQTGPQMRG